MQWVDVAILLLLNFRRWSTELGESYELFGIVSGRIQSADDLFCFVAHKKVFI